MATFHHYDIDKIDALPIASFLSLLDQIGFLRRQRVVDGIHAVAAGMSEKPGNVIRDLEKE